ncbi:MAG: cobalt ECF transporter T component CbiQ [Deltaproteobacteria bacterium]|nr:cobalt ECF transporter T component CbiQ [Deltaproteobacteria bacterium]
MSRLDSAVGSMKDQDRPAGRERTVRCIDPRAMLITTFIYIAVVTSFEKFDLLGLLPLVIYPLFIMELNNLSPGAIGRKLLYVSPCALMIGIFNPLFDNRVVLHLGSLAVSGGWISFTVLMVKFVLTASAALILAAICGFDTLCVALEKLKMPKVFVSQLLFMHRYIFLTADEASRMVRAHSVRSFRRKGMKIKVFGSLCGQLLLRTLDRALRIRHAMVSRGFRGDVPLIRELKAGKGDTAFVFLWTAFFIIARCFNLPQLLGAFVMDKFA